MLHMYLSAGLVPKNVQRFNDAFFDLYCDKIKFNKEVVSIIQSIDEVRYAGNCRIFSKFEEGVQLRVSELSTGCKTAINVYSFPQQVFYIGECGVNAIQVICNFDKGNVLVTDFFVPEDFHNQIKVISQRGTMIVDDNDTLEEVLFNEFGT